MSLSTQQLLDIGYNLQPDGSWSRHGISQKTKIKQFNGPRISNPVPPAIPHPVAQHPSRPALVNADKGKALGRPRVALRITRRGSKLLDCDNLAGGCKPLIDQLRYAGIIPNDDPASVEITFAQEKTQRALQGTLIEVLTIPA